MGDNAPWGRWLEVCKGLVRSSDKIMIMAVKEGAGSLSRKSGVPNEIFQKTRFILFTTSKNNFENL